MKKRSTWAHVGSAIFALPSLGAGEAWAVYSCTVNVTSAHVVYEGASVDSPGTVTLTCSRAGDETVPLDYSILAAYSPNALNKQRRAQLVGNPDYLNYELKKGTEGGGASCATGTDWQDSAKGASGKVIEGRLNFVGGALTASTTWGYCIHLPAVKTMPPAGVYTDTANVSAEFPGGSTSEAVLNYTVWVGDRCVFGTYPGTMTFNYTSFSPSPVTATQAFVLRCSQGTPWTVSVSPPAVPRPLGLDYSIAASPASGTGLGSTGQTITLTGTMPAGQAGTCATGTCTATQTHTVTITY